VAIIINKTTKISDFAQAIFRFRQLNKGTYLSIILIDYEDNKKYTLDEIYKLLNKNQDIFIKEQEDGIKLQILKTIIRKNTKNYFETNLKPEFIREIAEKINVNDILKDNIFNKISYTKLIKNMSEIPETKLIKIIYDDLSKNNNKKMKKLILGKGNEKIITIEQNKEQEQEQEKNIRINNYIENIKNFEYSGNNNIYIINYINKNNNNISNCCIKLFNTKIKINIKINDKEIYISYNFISNKISEFIFDNELSNIVFIEFENMILIEKKLIGMLYYLNKLPVYSFENGKIINPILAFNNKFTLNINEYFKKLFGLDIPIIKNIKDEEINNILKYIDNTQLYIIKIMLKLYIEKVYPLLPKIIEKISYNLLEKLNNFTNEFNNEFNNKFNQNEILKQKKNYFYNLNYVVHLPLINYNFNFNKSIDKPLINQLIEDSVKDSVKSHRIPIKSKKVSTTHYKLIEDSVKSNRISINSKKVSTTHYKLIEDSVKSNRIPINSKKVSTKSNKLNETTIIANKSNVSKKTKQKCHSSMSCIIAGGL